MKRSTLFQFWNRYQANIREKSFIFIKNFEMNKFKSNSDELLLRLSKLQNKHLFYL